MVGSSWWSAVGLIAVLLVLWVWPGRHTERRWVVASLSVIVLLGLAHQLMFDTTAEDAFITFRYARNLASGFGPVFNPGERVEGYSDFLWMIVLSVLNRFGIDIVLAARCLGSVAALLTVVLTYQLGCVVTKGDRPTSLSAALLVAASGSFAAYGPSGMETPVFALLLVATVLSTVRQRWCWAGLLVALATMTRPEGILCLIPILGWALVTGKQRRERLRNALGAAGAFGALAVPWTLWRVAYYGYWIPNPIAAKRGLDSSYLLELGFRYLYEFGGAHVPLVILLAVVTAAAVVDRFRTVAPVDGLLAAFVLILVGFVVSVGGDWMPAWRMLAPIIPVASVLLLSLWREHVRWQPLATSAPLGRALFVVAAGVLVMTSRVHPNLIPRVVYWSQGIDAYEQIGEWFRRSLPPDTWVATIANGALSYYSRLPMIDMMGLTDEHIARNGQRAPRGMLGHSAYDFAYVVRRRPQVVAFLGGVGFQQEAFHCRPKKEFQAAYDVVPFRFPASASPLGRYVNLILLRSQKQRLVETLARTAKVEVLSCVADQRGYLTCSEPGTD